MVPLAEHVSALGTWVYTFTTQLNDFEWRGIDGVIGMSSLLSSSLCLMIWLMMTRKWFHSPVTAVLPVHKVYHRSLCLCSAQISAVALACYLKSHQWLHPTLL
ncbi:hypothetical protein M378DRAFT_597336 [Amanita muscaria Koide BX008]|uniref:Uncharacterized protein n=1 Tax=Amanita muscaria (strain Koide BX008) TaxID=946122 RepID=A0A0C2RYK3_AMAMK|nr:hypothetical protein M378DRAFT_597336 [Amanita muscaria Koide BX008]